MPEDRRHAAIMFTDIVGYTALMGSDEDRAFEVLRKNRDLHKRVIKKYRGELIKEMGDGTLISFQLASDAVRCAQAIQKEAKKQNIPLKIGIHEGEMVFAGADVLGDGVNIASRLQESAEEGCITISGAVHRNVKNKAGIKAEFIGEKRFKNVDEPIKVYKVHCEEGVEEEKFTKNQEPGKFRNRLPHYIIAVVVVVIAVIVIWQFLPFKDNTSSSSPGMVIERTIAVLPFMDDSPDKDNEYLCNGMMDAIITHLQKIGDLQVKSRTSVEQYRNPTRDIKEIGKELEVAFVVEGSVSKIGDNIRINSQLIDVNTGNHLWAEYYDGKFTENIFEFQSSIAKKVAASLQAVITPQEEEKIDEKPTSEIAAYDLSLRGWEQYDKWNAVGSSHDSINLSLALNLFNQALEVDPEYIDALSGKGRIFLAGRNYDSAMYYYNKVIELYPDRPEGYSEKGFYFWVYLNQADSAYKYYTKATELGPNDFRTYFGLGQICVYLRNEVIRGLSYLQNAYDLGGKETHQVNYHLAHVYRQIGDYQRAEKYCKESFYISQQCGFINTLTSIFLNQGRNDEALHFLDSICSITACGQRCDVNRYYAYLNKKEFKQAEEYCNKAVDQGYILSNYDSMYIAYLYKNTGRETEATTILERTIKELENFTTDNPAHRNLPVIYRRFATTYAIMDENEKALRYISEFDKMEFIENKFDNWSWLDYIQIDPIFENLRDNPEFKAIVKRAKEQKAAIRAQLREMEEQGDITL